jgi:xanthine dehydrogenase accessory factor
MLEQISPLWPAFQQAREQQRPLVLATLIRVQGSSYKKPGAMMLVEADRTTHGLLSGGCLEADIAEHAEAVFANGQSRILSYDLSDDSLFGLGAGCDGTIDILLQLLTDDYLPFSALNPGQQLSTDTQLTVHTINLANCPTGAWQIRQADQQLQSHQDLQDRSAEECVTLDYRRPPAVLIMGAGTDAIPLCELLLFQHWHCYLMDHRLGRLKTAQDDQRIITMQLQADTTHLPGGPYDAAIIMSHNLERDARYLDLVSRTDTPFIGLLGPVARRDKVLQLAGLSLEELTDRLHAPVGLKLGGRLPENIAVSVIAELQAHFYKP